MTSASDAWSLAKSSSGPCANADWVYKKHGGWLPPGRSQPEAALLGRLLTETSYSPLLVSYIINRLRFPVVM